MPQKSRFTGSSRRSSSSSHSSSSHQAPPTQQQTRNYSTSTQQPQQARPQQQTTPPPQHQQTPVQSGGPGIMGNIVSTVAGTMIGHAIYDSVSNAFGSKDSNGEQQQYSPQEMQKCFSQMQSFSQCLEQNPYSIGSCQYAFDSLNECKRGLTPMPQQPQQTNQNSEW
ncbi:hypothetical protein C9374_012312 [Naegleria lovaniensis]|uniref:CHCH domain-containing protein n=1 Tax=Naegleria lovaniensis TaxID=51637 RepID=A0AA88GCL2_NAELO|nr:uncharacterized protein C9374_012312 [Naegleria lovaniensis]KAG2373209.1 hypothetical protein C9374_012312 [Naegleria lovaniensis]